jgi:hypothetical protein
MAELLRHASPPVLSERALCADVSDAHAEPLAATASRVDHWLLVEYRGLWSRDTIGGSELPASVKGHLRAQVAALPRSRVLFIRRPDRRREASISVYFGRTLEADHRFFALELSRYEELLELDFQAALTTRAATVSELAHPLLLVCTHGKRDRCCAKYGRPLYDELRAEAEPHWVWQSTHVGGDRFAGNLVCLPEGLYFGRVGRSSVWPLLDDYLGGRIDLAHYRGRACYPFPVQAAERRVREEAGACGVDDLSLVSFERTGDGEWTVAFRVRASADVHEVAVAAEFAEAPTYLTCSAASPERPRRHVVRSHRVRRAA